MLQVENIVGSGLLPVEIDLQVLSDELGRDTAKYDPELYPGMYYRRRDDDPLVVLYTSGKYIITGAKSTQQLNETRDGLLDHLTKLGVLREPMDSSFQLQNIVFTSDIGHEIDLNALSIGLGLEQTEYEPEQFPGLVYRPLDADCVILVFTSGKVVITGTPDRDHAEEAFQNMMSQLEEM